MVTEYASRRTGSATTSGGSGPTPTFQADYPDWKLTFGIEDVLRDIHAFNAEAWLLAPPPA